MDSPKAVEAGDGPFESGFANIYPGATFISGQAVRLLLSRRPAVEVSTLLAALLRQTMLYYE